jgi:hypothetical protein
VGASPVKENGAMPATLSAQDAILASAPNASIDRSISLRCEQELGLPARRMKVAVAPRNVITFRRLIGCSPFRCQRAPTRARSMPRNFRPLLQPYRATHFRTRLAKIGHKDRIMQ